MFSSSSRHGLRIVSWNIDGLDETYLLERTRAIAYEIFEYRPDAVYLQEIVPANLTLLQSLFKDYHFFAGDDTGSHYFNGIAIHKYGLLKVFHFEGKGFPNSNMGRHLLFAYCYIPYPSNGSTHSTTTTVSSGSATVDLPSSSSSSSSTSSSSSSSWSPLSSSTSTDETSESTMLRTVLLITSHFESCREGSSERIKQMHTVMNMIRQSTTTMSTTTSSESTSTLSSSSSLSDRLKNMDLCIFAGDTNLREKECTVDTLQKYTVEDAWIQTGSHSQTFATWDTRKNTNKTIPGNFKPFCRFDRLWYRNNPGLYNNFNDYNNKEDKSSSKVAPFVPYRATQFRCLGTSVLPPLAYDGLVSKDNISSFSSVRNSTGTNKGFFPRYYPSDHWGICVDFEYSAVQGKEADTKNTVPPVTMDTTNLNIGKRNTSTFSIKRNYSLSPPSSSSSIFNNPTEISATVPVSSTLSSTENKTVHPSKISKVIDLTGESSDSSPTDDAENDM